MTLIIFVIQTSNDLGPLLSPRRLHLGVLQWEGKEINYGWESTEISAVMKTTGFGNGGVILRLPTLER